jgi:hopene-associated glycosyltransferase HpnB
MTPALIVALAGLGAWFYLIGARGQFFRATLDGTAPAGNSARVIAIVPARNEADSIATSVRSLLEQELSSPIQVIVVDDHSTDGTAERARAGAAAAAASERLSVIAARSLPAGWTGKVWAMQEGLEAAREQPADFILFTDADIRHERGNLASLVARAEKQGLDLVSVMVRLRCQSWAERAFIPAFVFFFRMLYPFAWVNDPRRRMAAAAGGCMLVRRGALERIGGLSILRDALIDDCALGRAIKRGGPIWLGLTDAATSLRGYPGARDVFDMIARSAFTQLNHSALLLAATVLAMTVSYLAPPLLVVFATGPARLVGLVSWLAMALAYVPTLRFYRCSPLWAIVLPAIALFYLAATLESARRTWQGRGGEWKGRVQARSGA